MNNESHICSLYYSNLSEDQKKILSALNNNLELNIVDLSKITHRQDSNLLKAAEELRSDKFLIIKQTKPTIQDSEKKSLVYYSLSEFGKWFCLKANIK